jgi:hypothetical protein
MMDLLLPTPIKPRDAHRWIVGPALMLLPQKMDSIRARVMIVAIFGQESNLEFRRQHGNGPARGLGQFERRGGVRGVMGHASTQQAAKELCRVRRVDWDEMSVWQRLEFDDILCAGFSRLLLWADPRPLPLIGDADGAWDCYLRNWRPGRPHPQAWARHYAAAIEAVK